MAGHNNNDNKGKEGNKKLGIIAGIVVVAVVVFVGVVVFVLHNRQGQGVQKEEGGHSQNFGVGTVIDSEKDVSEPIETEPESKEEGNDYSDYYFVQMSSNVWHFESGDSPSYDALVSNADVNDCKVYFDVTLDADDEMVFKSPILKPGEMMGEITLGKVLESGTYGGVLVYHLLDPETEEEYSDLSIKVTIIIE